MAQPGDLPGVGDDHVGVDDGRVVLGVSTGAGKTKTFISSRDISCFSSDRKKQVDTVTGNVVFLQRFYHLM